MWLIEIEEKQIEVDMIRFDFFFFIFEMIIFVYFIGIGGFGMSGFVKMFFDVGICVLGSDCVDSDNLCVLVVVGVIVYVGYDVVYFGDVDIVVYMGVIWLENLEFVIVKV